MACPCSSLGGKWSPGSAALHRWVVGRAVLGGHCKDGVAGALGDRLWAEKPHTGASMVLAQVMAQPSCIGAAPPPVQGNFIFAHSGWGLCLSCLCMWHTRTYYVPSTVLGALAPTPQSLQARRGNHPQKQYRRPTTQTDGPCGSVGPTDGARL